MTILGIDVGTSSVKAAAVDSDGTIVGPVGRTPYEVRRPVADAAEIDPRELWAAITKSVTEATAGAPPVEGVGLSCLTPALVLLDESREVVAPIRIHQDRRAVPVSLRVMNDCLDEFLATVGNAPLPGGLSGLIYAQLAAEDSSITSKVRHYLHANSWVGLTLTGEAAFDPGNASFTGLFNTVTDSRWSPRWCDYFGVNPDWLPPVRDGRDTLGGVLPEVAKTWGVPAGIPVKLGLPDTSSGALSVRLKPGELLHSVGTTQVLMAVTPDPKPGLDRLTRRQGVGPEFVAVAHNPVGGVALDWIYELAFRDIPEDEFFAKVIPACIGRETAVKLDPPFLGGDRHVIELRLASFVNVGLDTKREDLLAAVLHAMRDGHRQACAALGIAPGSPTRVVLTGGGADSVEKLIPEYRTANIVRLDDGALKGCARLFDTGE